MTTHFGICLGNFFLVGCNFKSRDYFQHFFQCKVVISQKKEKCFQITTTTKRNCSLSRKKKLLVKLLLSIAFASHDSLTTATPPFLANNKQRHLLTSQRTKNHSLVILELLIVESLYLLMGKKMKILPNKFAIYEIKDLVMKKKTTTTTSFFQKILFMELHQVHPKKILSDFFFLLSFSPPKKLILLRSPSPFKNKTSKNEFNQNKLQLSRVGRAILL